MIVNKPQATRLHVNCKWQLAFAFLMGIAMFSAEAKDFPVTEKNCASIQAAIDAAHAAGGGRVVLTPGEYPVKTLNLKSHVELHLEDGAIVKVGTNRTDCAQFPHDVDRHVGRSFIQAWDAEDIAITGSGVIDGNGIAFFDKTKKWLGRSKRFYEPLPGRAKTLIMVNCRNVRLQGVTFANSQAWMMHLRKCENLDFSGIKILNDIKCINTDGIDFDGCRHVRVSNCDIRTGDDSISIRAIVRKGENANVVAEDFQIENCRLESACQCIRMGCPSDDTIRDIRFKNLTLKGAFGINFDFPSRYLGDDNDGNVDIHDVTFENVTGALDYVAVRIVAESGVKIRGVRNVMFRNFDIASRLPLEFKGNIYSRIERIHRENFTLNGERLPDGEISVDCTNSNSLRRLRPGEYGYVPPVAYDVAVFGGGVAGIAAALQAGRAGARTLLVERGFQVGGNMTTGGVNFPGLFHAWGRQIIDGCAYEILTNAVTLSGGTLPDFSVDPGSKHWKHQINVSIPVYVAVAEEALSKTGVTLRYHTAPVEVTRTTNNMWQIKMSATGKIQDIRAKVLIDCTGDGTLAALAGGHRMRCETISPGSFMYTFANGHELWSKCDQTAVEAAFRKAVDNGELKREDAPRGIAHAFCHAAGTSWNYVADADASTAERRTRTNMAGRASMLRLYRFLRRQPGLEGLRLVSCSPEVGIRETYRVEGDYMVSEDDYVSGRIFPDAVCNAFYPIDMHSVEQGVSPRHLARGTVATVPLRALYVKGVPNMLVAGRCMSADRAAASALRVQGTCMATGQAAGATAAMAASKGCDVRDVPIEELRANLRASGAIVPAPATK